MQLPKADNFSSTLTTLTVSGSELRMCLSSLSVVLLGTSSPFLLPAVVLPTILVPPTVVWITGMKDPSSLQKTLQKLQEPPAATRQYPFVSLAKTPISLEFSYCTLLAIVMIIINPIKEQQLIRAPHLIAVIVVIAVMIVMAVIIFIMMAGCQMQAQQCVKLIQKKQYLVDRYFVGQHQFDQDFVRIVFEIQADPQVQQLITDHAGRILMSKQMASIHFLKHLLAQAKYQHLAQTFLLGLIELKIKIYNQPLLLYILRTLPELIAFLNRNNQQFIHAIITFLSLNMRSFHRQVKLTATQALKDLAVVVGKEKGEWEKVMKRVVPMMVEKQQLVKEVSYIKGLFLQMLEDQLHQVRILTIHCLGIYRTYLKPQDLKQIIIYMLNDQHELVREEALQTAKSLKDLPLGKEDLSTLLMCLREKRTNLRRLVYENLSLVRINDIYLVPLLLQKALLALQNYRSDKKHIYRALYEIGRKYYLQMGKIFSSLGLNEVQEPNCKNIAYKAKMVLCHVWWKKKTFTSDGIRLPAYFVKHILYISDVQAYLFESPSNLQEETQSSVDSEQLKHNFHHLVRFIECQEDISQEFHKTLLEVAREMVVGHSQKEVLLQKLANLSISFNLGKEEQDIKTKLQTIIQQHTKDIDAIIEIVMACIQNREAFQLKNSFVAYNKCTVSRLQPNLVVSSKCQQFIERVYLKCWKHTLINRDRKVQYKRLSELQRLTQSQPSYFWRANLAKYNQVQIVLLTYENEEKVLDNFELQQK